MTDRINVMYAGFIVETATTGDLFDAPVAPVHRGPAALDAPRRRPRGRAPDPDRGPATRHAQRARPAARSPRAARGASTPAGPTTRRSRPSCRGTRGRQDGPGRHAPDRVPQPADPRRGVGTGGRCAPATCPRRRPRASSTSSLPRRGRRRPRDGGRDMTAEPTDRASTAAAAADGTPLLAVRDLKVWFPITEGMLARAPRRRRARRGRRLVRAPARRDAGPRRRVGLRQEHDGPGDRPAVQAHRRDRSSSTARTSRRSTARSSSTSAAGSR